MPCSSAGEAAPQGVRFYGAFERLDVLSPFLPFTNFLKWQTFFVLIAHCLVAIGKLFIESLLMFRILTLNTITNKTSQ